MSGASHRAAASVVLLVWSAVLATVAVGHSPLGAEEEADEALLPAELRFERPWQRPSACGPNCLYLLLRHHGLPVDLERLIEEMAPPKKGSSLYELKGAADKRGLRLSVLRTTPIGLDRLSCPFIAHMEYTKQQQHFLVVCRLDEYDIHAVDGTTFREQRIDKGTFLRSWSGYVLATMPGSALTLVIVSVTGALVVFGAGYLARRLRKRPPVAQR